MVVSKANKVYNVPIFQDVGDRGKKVPAKVYSTTTMTIYQIKNH